jgi:hypothetical protein
MVKSRYKMKRIRIWADTHSSGIFEDDGRFLLQNQTTISNETWDSLQNWVEKYDEIIPLNSFERIKRRELINDLDKEGHLLLEKIKNEWKYDLETGEKLFFSYCSEGLYDY